MKLEAQDLNNQAAMLIKVGNLDAAAEKINKAIECDPMVVDSYRNYGDICMAKEDYKEAKKYYNKAILIEKNGLFYFLYGNACFMMDDVHEGLKYYNLAIDAGYDDAEMMFFMGMAYEHLNDDQMALRFFNKACVKNSSRPDFMIRRIAALIRLGENDQAEKYVDELISVSPESFEGYHIKTTLLIDKGDFESAIKFAKEASDRFPEDPDLMFDYVKSITLSGDFDKALTLISSAKKMKYFEGAKPDFCLLEGQIYAEKQDVSSAITCCNQCIALENEEFFANEARFMLMNLYLAERNFDKCYEHATALVNKKLEDDYYFAAVYYQPFSLKELGKVEEAKMLFKDCASYFRVITLEETNAIDIYLYRALCLKEIDQTDKALEILDFVTSLTGDIAEVYSIKAQIYKELGQDVLAEEARKKAYSLKPELQPVEKEGV